MRDQTALWLTLGEGAVLMLMFLFMPVASGRQAFFGARVDEETFGGRGREILRHYRSMVAAVVVLVQACGYLLAVRFASPLPAVLASLVTLAAGTLVYVRFAREVRPLAAANGTTRFASSLHARRLGDYTNPLIEAVVFAATLAPIVLLAAFYAELPDPLPVHWNGAGEADRWEAKSATSVFFLPALGVYLQAWLVMLKHDIAHAKMIAPADGAAEYLRGKERFRRANMHIADVSRVSVGALLLLIALLLATAMPSLRSWQPLVGAAIWAAVAAMSGGVFFFLWRASRINREMREVFGDSHVQRPADEARWRGGGLDYNNPEDASLMVEKLVGLGYTYNTAHPAFRVRLALLAGVGMFVVWALLDL